MSTNAEAPTYAEILTNAEAAGLECVRLRCRPRSPAVGEVGGTWLGASTHDHRAHVACPICGGELGFAAQIDPAAVLGPGAGLWCLYLCDVCLDEAQPRVEGAYALVHVPAAQLHAATRIDGQPRISKLVAGSWELVGEKGRSFPSIEDFFERYFAGWNEGCPEWNQERDYCEIVEGFDPRATVDGDGCFPGERVFQIGGHAELCYNIASNCPCSICGGGMVLLFAAPNQPRVWTRWLDNFVLAAWVCPTHPGESG